MTRNNQKGIAVPVINLFMTLKKAGLESVAPGLERKRADRQDHDRGARRQLRKVMRHHIDIVVIRIGQTEFQPNLAQDFIGMDGELKGRG